MAEFLRQHWTYIIGAVLLHALFAGIFGLTLIQMARNAPPPQLAIQAVVVDQTLLGRASRQQQRERERLQQREREQAAAKQQQQEKEKQKEVADRREAEQRAEQERQTELKQREEQEQRRQAEEQQVREREDADRKREAEAVKQKQAEAERKRVAEIERKQKEAAERRKAAEDSKAQAAREAELRSQLEEEEGRDRAANSGLLNQYVAMIEQRIVRNWYRPPSARPGLECEVRVAQTRGGAVLSVQLGRCNGDAAIRESIKDAVLRSSPLPPPPDPRLFERNLVLIFKPLE